MPVIVADTIRGVVGAETLRRGQRYARQGAVVSVRRVQNAGEPAKLVGQVRGSAPWPYAVVVTLSRVAGDTVTHFGGTCTCPMRTNCKHVAAVLVATGAVHDLHDRHDRRLRSLAAPDADRSARGSWERSVGALIGTQPEATGATTLGLQFELTGAPHSPQRLSMRPVRRGAQGRWVRSDVSWSSLSHYGSHIHGARPEHLSLLKEILTLSTSSSPFSYYRTSETQIYLETMASPRIWSVLAEAQAAGLPLIRSGKEAASVRIQQEPAEFSLDLSRADGEGGDGVTIAARMTAGGEPIAPSCSLLLGDPAHGIAWWPEPDQPGAGGVALPPVHGLRLARLSRLLTGAAPSLYAASGRLRVPSRDWPRFLVGYYPTLRRQVTLSSTDGSVELPSPQPPRLQLEVEHGQRHATTVEWSWRYCIGEAVTTTPLWPPSHGAPERDTDAEAAVVASVLALDGSQSLGREPGPDGPRLASSALLAGMDAVAFARDLLPALESLPDLDVRVVGEPADFREADTEPVIRFDSVSGKASNDWLDLAVSVTVEGEQVPFQALFVALAEQQEFLLLPSGTYFRVDRPEFARLRTLIEEARALGSGDVEGALRVSRYQASFWEELQGLGVLSAQAAVWGAATRRLLGAEVDLQLAPPPSLRATLRPYQQLGYAWLAFLYEHQLGGVLADDMGLGKTVQALALVVRAREQSPDGPPFLVVAPTSVVGNWVSECHRFTDLATVAITETGTRRGCSLADVIAGADVVVTSYALFRLEFEEYAALSWSGLVLDEAQWVKNHQSKGFQCAKRLTTPFKLAITGTPMENNLMELWSMFSITAPGLFAEPARFTDYYRTPIEREGNRDRLDQMRRRMRPLMIRRTKESVAADLPDKLEQVMELDLNPRHKRAYETYLQRERRKVLGLLGDLNRNRFEILRSLTLLRQASIHPALVDAKHASVPSTKLDALMEHLDDIVAEGHRVLVFSQFTRFLSLVRAQLDREGIEYCYLDGRTRNRPRVLAEFATGTKPVFLISLKAGGVGLNLTEADYVILLDPWWNPATEAQAVDRTHRIGQTKKVMVYRFVAKDTIEEKVMALKEDKAALVRSVLDEGGAGSGALTASDIRTLLE